MELILSASDNQASLSIYQLLKQFIYESPDILAASPSVNTMIHVILALSGIDLFNQKIMVTNLNFAYRNVIFLVVGSRRAAIMQKALHEVLR